MRSTKSNPGTEKVVHGEQLGKKVRSKKSSNIRLLIIITYLAGRHMV